MVFGMLTPRVRSFTKRDVAHYRRRRLESALPPAFVEPAVKSFLLATVLASLLLPAGCAVSQQEASAREWQRSECNRIVDREARERCMKRIE